MAQSVDFVRHEGKHTFGVRRVGHICGVSSAVSAAAAFNSARPNWPDSIVREPAGSGIIASQCVRPRTMARGVCGHPGANWVRPDSLKCGWRAVVGQLATLKADQNLQLLKIPLLWLPKS